MPTRNIGSSPENQYGRDEGTAAAQPYFPAFINFKLGARGQAKFRLWLSLTSQKVKRASSCIVRAVAWVRRPKLPEPVVVTSPPKLV